MERTNRAVTSNKNRMNARNSRNMYVNGSAVRKMQEAPARPYHDPERERIVRERRAAERSNREISQTTRRNREKALNMGRGFVLFLAAVSVAVLFFCVTYLQLQSQKTAVMSSVAELESTWSELKEENDAYESQVNSDVDLNSIKRTAIGSLGMNYPTDEQTMTYSVPDNSYVRQYQDVPASN